jgi:hypothetical protein
MPSARNKQGKAASTHSKVGAGQARYRVRPGTQVHHDDRVHHEGENLVADKATALAWVERGYVEEVS